MNTQRMHRWSALAPCRGAHRPLPLRPPAAAPTVALAWPARRSVVPASQEIRRTTVAAASVIDVEPPAQRSGGSDTDTDTGADSPFNSMDADFSDAAVSAAASLDDTELWRRVSELAEEQGSHDAEGSHADDGGGKMFGMSASLRGMLLLNLGAALFGSNMVAIKAAEDSMSSTALSAMRFGIAAAVFAPYVWRGLKLPHVRNNAAELALWLFGGYTAQAAGLEMTSAARGAFTGTFTVVAVPLLVGLSGRRVAWSTWVAAVVALLGVGMLTSSGGDPTWGDALCICSATLFGVHKWRSESVTAEVKETTELIAVQLAALAVASALVTVPELYHAFQGHDLPHVLDSFIGLPWPALVFMGLGTTALTLWIEMNALKDVSSPVAAIIYSAEPLWGAGLAYFLLGERWGTLGWFGAALIIASSLGAQLGGDKTEKAGDKKQKAA